MTRFPEAVVRPGDGMGTVLRWIRVLHRGTADDSLWTALTFEWRLTVAQLYLISLGSRHDDVRAARLASDEPADPDFPLMLHRQCQAWRKAYLPLARGAEPVSSLAVGADMELVAVEGRPARPGHGDAPAPRFRFLVRHRRDETAIAAIGHRLPIPGWPPTQWAIPHLRKG